MYSTVHITVQIYPMAQVYSILDVHCTLYSIVCIAGTELVQEVWNLRFQLNVSRLVIMW
jgi:hypothetical protein